VRDLEAIGKPSTIRFIHSTTVLVRMLSTLDLVGSRTSCDGNGTGPVFQVEVGGKVCIQTRNSFV